MKTGIELIAQERTEQIEKHGRHIMHDVQQNSERQLIDAAKQLLTYHVYGWNPLHCAPTDLFLPIQKTTQTVQSETKIVKKEVLTNKITLVK